MTYLACDVRDRARCNFSHFDDLRYMLLDFDSTEILSSARVVPNDICAITITFNILC
jgi:hypothetical protein